MHSSAYTVPHKMAEIFYWDRDMEISLRIGTIRHTGTHFLFHTLANLGYNEAVIDFKTMTLKYKNNDHFYLHSHIEMGRQIIMQTPCAHITTMRNPVEVFRTHLYRYHWNEDVYVPYIINAFEQRQQFIDDNDAYVFRVDGDQETEVTKLAAWLGVTGKQYKELPTNILSTRVKPCEKDLFINPPKIILDLATRYGY